MSTPSEFTYIYYLSGYSFEEEVIIMMEIIDYLKARYLSEKGQGMAEYALVLAFVVAIIVAVGTTGLSDAIKSAFDKVSGQIAK